MCPDGSGIFWNIFSEGHSKPSRFSSSLFSAWLLLRKKVLPEISGPARAQVSADAMMAAKGHGEFTARTFYPRAFPNDVKYSCPEGLGSLFGQTLCPSSASAFRGFSIIYKFSRIYSSLFLCVSPIFWGQTTPPHPEPCCTHPCSTRRAPPPFWEGEEQQNNCKNPV